MLYDAAIPAAAILNYFDYFDQKWLPLPEYQRSDVKEDDEGRWWIYDEHADDDDSIPYTVRFAVKRVGSR